MTNPQPQPATEPMRHDGLQPGELPAFDRAARGYHAGQVDDFIRGLLHRLHEAERGLARGAAEVEQSPRSQQLVDELLKLALDEIDGQKAAALAQAAQILDGARSQAGQITATAQDEAARMVSGAREQSDTLLAGARATAKSHLDTATAQAAAISEGAGRRMLALTAAHEQTLSRLTEINNVTGRLLGAEGQRGDLHGEVERALGVPAPAVQAAAPGKLTASGAASSQE